MIRWLRAWRVLTLTICLLFLIGLLAFSAVKVEVLSSAKDVAPGEFATHVFSVLNDSSSADTLDFVFTIPDNWALLGAPTNVSLDPGEQQTLFVTVTVPSDTAAGEYEVTLTATSQEDYTQSGTASGLVNVSIVNELEVILPHSQSVQPGSTVTYEIGVINRGNAQDTVSIEATSAEGFPVSISDSTVSLAPQERFTVTLKLEIPVDADAGRDLLTISVASQLYAGVAKQDSLFTTVLPSPPQAIGGTLMEELPSRLSFSVGQNVFTGNLDSSLTLSISGGVLDGYFSSYLSFASIFGPDALDLTRFSISYRQTPSVYELGDVYARITNLLSLHGRGGSIEIDDAYYGLTFVGCASPEEGQAAISLAVGPSVCRLGIAHLERRSESSNQIVWSLTGKAEPFEDWTIGMEGALGKDNNLSSSAFLFNTDIDSGSYYFNAQVFSVGSYFPGLRRDSAGLSVSQRIRISAFSFAASMSHDWDNLSNDPSFSRTISDELGVNMSATPIEQGPIVNATVEFTWARDPELTAKNDVRRVLFFELRNLEDVLPYSFSGKVSDQLDHITEMSYRSLTFSEGIGLSIKEFDIFVRLTHTKNIELETSELISGGTVVDISCRADGSPHSGSISFTNDEDEFDLSVSVKAEIISNFDLDLRTTVGWDRADATPATFSWGAAFSWRFDLPVLFLVTKSRVNGHVFLDQNSNRQLDGGDLPLEGVIVSMDRIDVSTDDNGWFRFPPVKPGSYRLDVSHLPLNAQFVYKPTVSLSPGMTADIDIPLTPVSFVEGVLFNDVNKDGIRSEDEGGFAQVRIILANKQGDEIDSYTKARGEFSFSDILPGQYELKVDATTLPDRFVFTTEKTLLIDVSSQEHRQIELGGYIKSREVVITFQPPTADFYFSPAKPQPGEEVTFDASDSFDFDGQVVSYAWDFDADGETDAEKPIVKRSFPKSGSYQVTLTITDNDGNTDSITYTIEVH
jgi:hypothetical protein